MNKNEKTIGWIALFVLAIIAGFGSLSMWQLDFSSGVLTYAPACIAFIIVFASIPTED